MDLTPSPLQEPPKKSWGQDRGADVLTWPRWGGSSQVEINPCAQGEKEQLHRDPGSPEIVVLWDPEG